MLIYSGTKHEFNKDIQSNSLADKINLLFWQHGLQHENESEYLSWKNSLAYMQKILDKPYFPDGIQIAIEYQIPQTSKRVDFIIAGQDDNSQDNVIVIELKQWQSARRTSRKDIVKAYTGGQERDVAHPSYQAYSYAKTIENFNEVVTQKNIKMHPCAYLHNYDIQKIGELTHPDYWDVIQEAPLYIKSEEDRLRDFIHRYITKPATHDIMYDIDHGRIRPSKALQDAVGSMLNGNQEFIMIDEQKLVYETVLKIVDKALIDKRRYTVIIEGGPGTGKSVVAIQLLATLIRKGINAQYVTKNAAPRNVYFEELRREHHLNGYVKNLFKSSASYVSANPCEVDCVLVDEAHRLNAKSGFYGSFGENQIKELIFASKVSVFFIDEQQIVTVNDIGSVDEIKRCASEIGSIIYHNDSTVLHSQFRCNGSDGYIAFLDDLLGIKHTANADGFDSDYDIQLFDDPCQLRENLRKKNDRNNKSRLLAGYCYEWKSKNDRTQFDIILPGGFKAQWNFNNTSTWAIDQGSFDQVGCIHTSQGLEFDYVGVIIGKDLLYRDGQVVTAAKNRARSDYSLRGVLKKSDPNLSDKIIRNTYKTLMTRGQKGCYIYCQDVQLQEYVRKRLEYIKQLHK